MLRILPPARLRLSSADRIALAFALRGSLSVLVPLVVFQLLGNPAAGLSAAIAGLNTPLADSGGTYANRLLAMAFATLVLPLLLFLGTQAHVAGGPVALLMALIALGGGLARVFGQSGATLGLYGGLAFLIGLEVPASPLQGLEQAAAYFAGGLWSIGLALIFWRLRPWRRLEQELAGCFETAAKVIATFPAQILAAQPLSHEAERQLGLAQAQARETIERVRATLGERGSIIGVRATTLEPFVILLRAASRVSGLMLAIAEGLRGEPPRARASPGRDGLSHAVAETAAACHEVAQALLARRPAARLPAARARAEQLCAGIRAHAAHHAGGREGEDLRRALPPLELALIHLANAEDALRALFQPTAARRGMGLGAQGFAAFHPAAAWARVSAQLTLQSTLFRHSLRVAAASGLGVMLMAWLDLPHGIWVPLTALVVLQPNFGGTFSRALARTGGTILGAGFAAILVSLLHGVEATDAALMLLVFGAFFFLRRRYAVGVFFLTPYVILLLSLVESGPWANVQDRVGDTLIGAALALVAGYFLWPSWERKSLPEQLALALLAARDQMAALRSAFAVPEAPRAPLYDARRQTEIAVANAAAAFQRMLAEPPRHRRRVGRTLAQVAYLQRLARHLAALAFQLEAEESILPELPALLAPLIEILETTADALRSGRPAAAPDMFPETWSGKRGGMLAAAAEAEARGGGNVAGQAAERLLDQIASDVASLQAAAG